MPDNNKNPENQLSQISQDFDINTLTFLLGLMHQVEKEKGNRAKPKDFINVLEELISHEVG